LNGAVISQISGANVKCQLINIRISRIYKVQLKVPRRIAISPK